MDLNNLTLIGRLTRDIDVRYTTQGTAIGRMSIACNRMKKDEVDYFDVEVWGKMAESLKQYLTKGKQIAITGRLKQDRWEKDGKQASKVGIVAENIQLIGSNGNSGNQSQAQQPTEIYDPWANQDTPF